MNHAAQDRLLTAEDLIKLPDDDQKHELIQGNLTSEPPASYRHGLVAAQIYALLRDFALAHTLGKVVSFETGFLLARAPDTIREPDVAFVSEARLKAAGAIDGFFPGPPDLAVEVLSPSDRPGEIHAKVADYLAAGTHLVWIVDPERRRVTVHRSLLSPRILGASDRLEGEDVLPGFAIAVTDLLER